MRTRALVLLIAPALWAQSPEQLFRDAVAAQQRGDDVTAIADYRSLLKIAPDALQLHVNLGAALSHAGRYDEAIAEYRAALAKAPSNKSLSLNLGLALYKKGDYRQAETTFAALHQADPQDVRTAILYTDCLSRLGKDAEAIAILKPLEDAHPDDLNIAWSLGSALIRAGKPLEGIKRVVNVAEKGHSADACFLAADTYLAIAEFERAGVFAQQALKLDPTRKGLYSLNGRIKQYLGDFPGSKADLAKALAENPDDFDAHVTLAAILNLERDVEGAELHARRALELKPSSPLARYQLARVERSKNDIAGAVRDFEKVIAQEPDWLRPHIELAALYYKLQRPEDGQKERAIVDRLYMQGKKLGPDADK